MKTLAKIIATASATASLTSCGSSKLDSDSSIVALLESQTIVEDRIICHYSAIVTENVLQTLSDGTFMVSTNIKDSLRKLIFVSHHEISDQFVNLPIDINPTSRFEMIVVYSMDDMVYELPIIRFKSIMTIE